MGKLAMMWARLGCLAALSTLAGCESFAVSPALFGPQQSYGYAPAPVMPQRPDALGTPAASGALGAASAARLDARATGALVPSAATATAAIPAQRAVILPVVPDPVEVSNAPVYDPRKDPSVTSVLLPPVATAALGEEGGPRTADGRPILPPTPMPRVIEIGSLRSGLAASAASD